MYAFTLLKPCRKFPRRHLQAQHTEDLHSQKLQYQMSHWQIITPGAVRETNVTCRPSGKSLCSLTVLYLASPHGFHDWHPSSALQKLGNVIMAVDRMASCTSGTEGACEGSLIQIWVSCMGLRGREQD